MFDRREFLRRAAMLVATPLVEAAVRPDVPQPNDLAFIYGGESGQHFTARLAFPRIVAENQSYREVLYWMTGRVNNAEWRGCQPGTVRLVGVNGKLEDVTPFITSAVRPWWVLTLDFAAVFNAGRVDPWGAGDFDALRLHWGIPV